MSRPRIPIACTLPPGGAEAQLGEWRSLRAHLVADEPIPGGRRLSFPIDLAPEVEDLAVREAACCAFLAIETHREADLVRVEISSEDPAAAPIIEALAGAVG